MGSVRGSIAYSMLSETSNLIVLVGPDLGLFSFWE